MLSLLANLIETQPRVFSKRSTGQLATIPGFPLTSRYLVLGLITNYCLSRMRSG
jgi:hypothetical protein